MISNRAVFTILFCVEFSWSQIDSANEELCLPLRHSSISTQPVQTNQGRPGKIGPPGLKGNPGEPGICECNPSEVEQLNNTIAFLTERLEEVSEKLQFITHFIRVPVNYYIENCSVGLKNGQVLNNDISASSVIEENHAAHQGRLDYQGTAGNRPAWVARNKRAGEWIQVDLKSPTYVTGVITQGRANANQWITSFKISYSNDGNIFRTIVNESGNDVIFQGNSDRNSYVINRFPRPITARFFRLIVQSWRNHVSIRLEYITC